MFLLKNKNATTIKINNVAAVLNSNNTLLTRQFKLLLLKEQKENIEQIKHKLFDQAPSMLLKKKEPWLKQMTVVVLFYWISSENKHQFRNNLHIAFFILPKSIYTY